MSDKMDPLSPLAPPSTPDLDDFKQLMDFMVHEKDIDKIKSGLTEHLKKLISRHNQCNVLFLFRATGSIDDHDSDRIYRSLPNKGESDILLILNSFGGRIEPAYFISKCIKERAKNKFVTSVPRRAKSAATLIALGSDEIHMGQLSELGPIDPQVGTLPALSLSSALDCIANLCKKYPESSAMFADYLAKTLPLNNLGYLERISESAEQYATRLLANSRKLKEEQITALAKKLVYDYKNHNFVIDKDESLQLFGKEIIKIETEEYKLGNEIYLFMEKVNLIGKAFKHRVFNIIGTADDIDDIEYQPRDDN